MQKSALAVALFVFALCTPRLQAQEAREDLSLAKLTKYYIAVLSKGPSWSEEKLKANMEKNREHIRKLVLDGKLVGAATSAGDGNVRSLFFFKTSKQEEVEGILKNAPSVKEGILGGSVHEVWGTRGLGKDVREKMKEDPERQLAREKHYLVVYSKGSEWSEKTNEETRGKLAESFQSINRLWKSGTLRFFAAVGDTKQDVRALGIFASSSPDEAMTVASDDPGVKDGWFTVKVFPVAIAEGVLP